MSYLIFFICNFLVLYFAMKIAALFFASPGAGHEKLVFFLGTPYFSLRSLRLRHASFDKSIILKFVLYSLLLAFSLRGIEKYLYPFNYFTYILISPLALLHTEALGAFAQLLFSFRKTVAVPIHNSPLLSVSLSDFWGHRWNRWTQDWLRDIGQRQKRRPLFSKLFYIFFFSGLFHELMFNLPYSLYSKEFFFGTMMGYFLIQGFGLWIEKTYFKHSPPWFKRMFMWLVILIPSPLFIRGPYLMVLGIANG